jgi:hypothetical protein
MAQSYTGDYAAKGQYGQRTKDKMNTAGEMAERIQDSTVYAAVCKAAREQPLATLAGAVAVGFMAGALWKLTRNQSTTERLASQFSSYAEPHLRSLRKSIWG